MNNDNLHPIHLQPFMDGTPLALERLRNAWLGLSFPDRAYLISVLLAGRGGHPNALFWKRHHGALLDLALADENAYIRYLAAKQTDGPEKSDDSLTVARLEKINSDSSQLVRSAQVEVGCISPALSRCANLAEIQGFRCRKGPRCRSSERIGIMGAVADLEPILQSL
jgi:hypothetical protein